MMRARGKKRGAGESCSVLYVVSFVEKKVLCAVDPVPFLQGGILISSHVSTILTIVFSVPLSPLPLATISLVAIPSTPSGIPCSPRTCQPWPSWCSSAGVFHVLGLSNQLYNLSNPRLRMLGECKCACVFCWPAEAREVHDRLPPFLPLRNLLVYAPLRFSRLGGMECIGKFFSSLRVPCI